MDSWFERDDLNKHYPEPLPTWVIPKIDDFIVDLNIIRNLFGAPIIISKRSGYRSVAYEISKGRSGNGEHTFKGKGAGDLKVKGGYKELLRLLEILKREPNFKRISLYKKSKFIHVDYKQPSRGNRAYYEYSPRIKDWILKEVLE